MYLVIAAALSSAPLVVFFWTYAAFGFWAALAAMILGILVSALVLLLLLVIITRHENSISATSTPVLAVPMGRFDEYWEARVPKSPSAEEDWQALESPEGQIQTRSGRLFKSMFDAALADQQATHGSFSDASVPKKT